MHPLHRCETNSEYAPGLELNKKHWCLQSSGPVFPFPTQFYSVRKQLCCLGQINILPVAELGRVLDSLSDPLDHALLLI